MICPLKDFYEKDFENFETSYNQILEDMEVTREHPACTNKSVTKLRKAANFITRRYYGLQNLYDLYDSAFNEKGLMEELFPFGITVVEKLELSAAKEVFDEAYAISENILEEAREEIDKIVKIIEE